MKRVKQFVFSVLSFSLAWTTMLSTVYAHEGAENVSKIEVTKKEQNENLLNGMVKKDTNLDDVDINNVYFYTAPIPVNTPSNALIGYIGVEDEKGNYLIELTGDMLDDFDSSTAGDKEFHITMNGYQNTVNVKVQESANLEDVGKPAGIRASIGFDNNMSKNVFPVGGIFKEGNIDIVDKYDSKIYSVLLTKDMIPDFDSSEVGEKVYPISYKGFSTELTINFHRWAVNLTHQDVKDMTENFKSPVIYIPLNGDLTKAYVHLYIYDVEDGSPYGLTTYNLYGDLYEGKKPIDMIDNTKVGVQNIEFKMKNDYWGGIMNGYSKIVVGTPEQKTVEDLLPQEAINTIPSGKVLGVWDVPSGYSGKGTWVFNTKLRKGSGVNVYSYHDNHWLNIGEFYTDKDGNVTVSFTENQLSPVIIVENGKKEIVEAEDENIADENNETTNNNKPQTDSTKQETTEHEKITESPQTSDQTNVALYLSFSLISLAAIAMLVYKKRKVQ